MNQRGPAHARWRGYESDGLPNASNIDRVRHPYAEGVTPPQPRVAQRTLGTSPQSPHTPKAFHKACNHGSGRGYSPLSLPCVNCPGTERVATPKALHPPAQGRVAHPGYQTAIGTYAEGVTQGPQSRIGHGRGRVYDFQFCRSQG
jgi:hypothetical protein